jgi:hypothetical protein
LHRERPLNGRRRRPYRRHPLRICRGKTTLHNTTSSPTMRNGRGPIKTRGWDERCLFHRSRWCREGEHRRKRRWRLMFLRSKLKRSRKVIWQPWHE